MKASLDTLTRLQPGMRVLYDGEPYRVIKVNDCCARIVPVRKRIKLFVPRTGDHAGQRVKIAVRGRSHDISPDSELDIL